MTAASLTTRVSNLALLITIGLLALLLVWQLASTPSAWPSSASPSSVWHIFTWHWAATGLEALPAVLVLASLWRHRPRARAWTILGAIPYATLGITELVANPGERIWALACALLAFSQFIVLAWLLRVQAARAG